MKLSINMRLYQVNDSQKNIKQRNFTEFFLKIKDDKYPIILNIEDTIILPSNIVLYKGNLANLIDFIYSNLVKNSRNANYIVSKTILIPKNINVKKISEMIMNRFPSEVHVYTNTDLIDSLEDDNKQQSQLHSSEFLRSLKIFQLPPGKLKLKVGVLIILL